MKIGILTFTDGTNYGQRLQNYALQTILKSYGHDVYTIQQEHKYSFKHQAKEIALSVMHPYKATMQKRREAAFSQFNNEYIQFYEELIPEGMSCNDTLKSFDLFIAGSDQIWNPYSPFVNSNFFMQFAPINKRASYAASFSVNTIPDEKAQTYRRWLSEIPFLSVREKQGVEVIHELTGKRVVQVLDPTLSIDRFVWESMARTAICDVPEKKYILSLFLGTDYEDEEKIIVQKTGYELLKFHDFYNLAPDQFLKLLKCASLVITDSYHVTIFSIIFNIPFVVFDRKSKGESMSSRFETLDYLFSIKRRCWSFLSVNQSGFLNNEISLNTLPYIEAKQKSIAFLNTILNGNHVVSD